MEVEKTMNMLGEGTFQITDDIEIVLSLATRLMEGKGK